MNDKLKAHELIGQVDQPICETEDGVLDSQRREVIADMMERLVLQAIAMTPAKKLTSLDADKMMAAVHKMLFNINLIKGEPTSRLSIANLEKLEADKLNILRKLAEVEG